MITIFKTARELQAFCDAQGWEFCFIGGVLTLLAGYGKEDTFIDALLAQYTARNANPAQFARKNRVLLLQSESGIGIDISLGALPFEVLAVQHATPFEFAPGLELRTCSAEDLMVMKLFASRAIDIRDAGGIAVRHDNTLDWRYVEEQLKPLVELKEEPEILQTFAHPRRLSATL